MLKVSRDKLCDDIDVNMWLKEDENEEKNKDMIVALYGKSVSHSGGQFKNDGIENQDAYIDLDDDRSEKVEVKLKESIRKALANGLS